MSHSFSVNKYNRYNGGVLCQLQKPISDVDRLPAIRQKVILTEGESTDLIR